MQTSDLRAACPSCRLTFIFPDKEAAAKGRGTRVSFLRRWRPLPHQRTQRRRPRPFGRARDQGIAHHAQQAIGLERLLQEISGTGLQRLHRDRHVAMSRHDDHRQPQPEFRQPALQGQAVDVGHPDIGQHAARSQFRGLREEFRGRGIGARADPGRFQQELD